MRSLKPYSALFLRYGLAASYLSAVADRFGFWGPPGASNVAWGNFENFLTYTAHLNPYLPSALVPPLGWSVTGAEVLLGVFMVLGLWLRRSALLSGVLLSGFAFGMILGSGIKAPLDFSVFTASAGSFLLVFVKQHVWCLDNLLENQNLSYNGKESE